MPAEGELRDRLVAGALGRRLLSLERQRRHWLARVPPGPLRDYYAQPFPAAALAATDVPFLVVDFETTGLDPRRSEILSIGHVPIRALALRLGERAHVPVRPTRPIPPASAVVHGITDDRARQGLPLAEALPGLLRALAGHVLVAHHAPLESGLLDGACRALYGHPFVGVVVDTLALERRSFERRGQPERPGTLRLAALRERYHLPRYRAHDALIDAVAAAELLLAQIAYRSDRRPPTLGELASVR